MIVLVIIAVVVLLLVLHLRDVASCRRINAARATRVCALAVASRASRLDECPPEFLRRLQAALDARDGDEPGA